MARRAWTSIRSRPTTDHRTKVKMMISMTMVTLRVVLPEVVLWVVLTTPTAAADGEMTAKREEATEEVIPAEAEEVAVDVEAAAATVTVTEAMVARAIVDMEMIAEARAGLDKKSALLRKKLMLKKLKYKKNQPRE